MSSFAACVTVKASSSLRFGGTENLVSPVILFRGQNCPGSCRYTEKLLNLRQAAKKLRG